MFFAEGLSKLTRASAERFFSRGGLVNVHVAGQQSFEETMEGILTSRQIMIGMALWTKRTNAVIAVKTPQMQEEAQSAQMELGQVVNYLRVSVLKLVLNSVL